MTGTPTPRRITLIPMLMAVTLLIALLLRLPALARLNYAALNAARWAIETELAPDWWLASEPAAESCLELPDAAGHHGAAEARLLRLQGLVDMACGRREAGTELLEQAALLEPWDDSTILVTAGHQAEADTPSATNSHSAAWGAAVEKAREAFDRGKRQEAVAWLDSVYPVLEESASIDRRHLYFSACFIYRRVRRLDASLLACQKLTAVAANDPEAWNLLGLVYLAQNRLDPAEAAFERAVQLSSRPWAVPHVNLGRVYMARGDLPAAAGALRQALALDRNNAWAHYYLASLLVEQADCAAATPHLRSALASDSSGVHSALARLLPRFTELCGPLD